MTVRWSIHRTWVNIGTGPAVGVEWRLSNTSLRGEYPYLKADGREELGTNGLKSLYQAGILGQADSAVIECSYSSLSGRHYGTKSTYDLVHCKFSTTFIDSGDPHLKPRAAGRRWFLQK